MARKSSQTHKPPEMMAGLRESPCPCCRGRDLRHVGEDNGFRVEKCRRCGMVFVNPRPTPEGLKVFYETYFHEDEETEAVWDLASAAIFEDILRWIAEGRSRPGDLLDVGCAFGGLLERAIRAGWTATGIEPSPSAAAVARRIEGATVLECGIEEADLEPESFDAVASVYVLEHVADPLDMMRRIERVLRPGGQAIVRVPWVEPLMPAFRALRRPLIHAPMHLNDFSPRVMRRIGRELGFREVLVDPGSPRKSPDRMERLGALVLGNSAKILDRATRGRVVFPFAGSYSYRFFKP